VATQIQFRRGTASQWTTSNPLLAQGEPGLETDTLKWKVGNGTQNWAALPYTLGATAPISYGTTLPGSPTDGQEAILVDSTTNPSYQWRFRWNAGSSSAYKWEYTGGAPVSYVNNTDYTSTTTGAWIDLDGFGFSPPRSGDYLFSGLVTSWHTAANGYFQWGFALTGGTPLYSAGGTAPVSTAIVTVPYEQRINGLAAGSGLVMRYLLQSTGTGHWVNRALTVIPVRVS